jgi:chromosome segregation ATPase
MPFKKALAVVAVATIASASANNLRAPASKTLLQRCTNGAKVEECCTQTPGQHALYNKKDDNNPGRLGKQCCSKSLGTWMPTNGEDADKFCSLGKRTYDAEKSMDQVKSVSDRMANALNALNAEKRDLKKEYRAAYIAHEKTENDADDKNAVAQKELNLVEDEIASKKATFNSLQKKVADEEQELEALGPKYSKSLSALDKAFDEASATFKAKQEALKDLATSANKANDALNTCNLQNEEDKKALKAIAGEIVSVKTQQDSADKERKQYEAKTKEAEATLEEKKKEQAAQIKEAEAANGEVKNKMAKFVETNAELQTMIDEVESKIADADAKLASFLETGTTKKFGWLFGSDGGNEDKETVKRAPTAGNSNFDANKYADGKLVKKGSEWVDSQQKMLSDAQNFINDRVSKMKDVLVNLKAVRSRVAALKKLDKDLHKQIMADLGKQNAKLVAAIKKANAQGAALSKMIFKAAGTLEKVQAKQRSVMASFEKKLEMKRVVLDKQQEDIKAITNTISSMKWRIVKLVAKNVACKTKMLAIKGAKKILEVNLDAQRKELTEITGKLTAAKDDLEDIKEQIHNSEEAHNAEITAITADTARMADESKTLEGNVNAKKAEFVDKSTELAKKDSQVKFKDMGI